MLAVAWNSNLTADHHLLIFNVKTSNSISNRYYLIFTFSYVEIFIFFTFVLPIKVHLFLYRFSVSIFCLHANILKEIFIWKYKLMFKSFTIQYSLAIGVERLVPDCLKNIYFKGTKFIFMMAPELFFTQNGYYYG